MPASPAPSALACLLCAAVLSTSCVKREDYERVQAEKKAVQAQLDQKAQQLQLISTQYLAAQQSLAQLPELQARLKAALDQVAEKQKEIDDLNVRWEKFRQERRGAMLGREYPELRLDEGRVLRQVMITALQDDELSLRHSEGVMKVLLSKSNDELRWQACYDPSESGESKRKALIARAKLLEQRMEADAKNAAIQPHASTTTSKSVTEAKILRDVIRNQRKALNDAYQRIRKQNPDALRGADWNSAKPEESGLINVFAQRRIVIGIGELDSLAAVIKTNLRKLQDLDSR